jgi:hypothetical protein
LTFEDPGHAIFDLRVESSSSDVMGKLGPTELKEPDFLEEAEREHRADAKDSVTLNEVAEHLGAYVLKRVGLENSLVGPLIRIVESGLEVLDMLGLGVLLHSVPPQCRQRSLKKVAMRLFELRRRKMVGDRSIAVFCRR